MTLQAKYMCSVIFSSKSTFAMKYGNATTQGKRGERSNEHIIIITHNKLTEKLGDQSLHAVDKLSVNRRPLCKGTEGRSERATLQEPMKGYRLLVETRVPLEGEVGLKLAYTEYLRAGSSKAEGF